jgi:hypothetical protein
MREQGDAVTGYKQNFNVLYMLCTFHQRAIIVPLRKNFGVEALGFPCLLALVVMVLWATFSHDILMWWYIALWFVFFLHRRMQAVALAKTGRIHSRYDGWPDLAKGSLSEKFARMFGEPILVGIAGYLALQWYIAEGMNYRGLPYFLLAGCFTLPFVEAANQIMWRRRSQAMMDARLEQQAVMDDFQRKWGE